MLAVGIGAAVMAAVVPMAGAAAHAGGSSPAGTWLQTVYTPLGAHDTELAFHPDGTVSGIAAAGAMPCPSDMSGPPDCMLGSASVGIWRITGSSTFEYTIREYVYDSSSNIAGFIVPHEKVKLSSDGNSYSSTYTTGVLAADGTVIVKETGNSSGTRMTFPSY